MNRAVRLLYLRGLTGARLRTALAVLAVVAGSSLALSVLIVRTSVAASLSEFGAQVSGAAPLRVVGADSTGGLEDRYVARVAATSGVALAVPVVEAATVVATADGRHLPVVALGVDCRSGALLGQPACATPPTGPAAGDGPVLVSRLLARRLGARSWIGTAAGATPLAAPPSAGAPTGTLVVPALDGVNGGAVVVMPLPRAQLLFDRAGRLDSVYVVPARGMAVSALQARLARAVGPQNDVLRSADPPAQVLAVVNGILPLLTLLAVLAAGIAVVLVYNVVNLSFEERRRQFALWGAIGAPPSLLVAGPLLEGALLGGVGGLVGAAAGRFLAAPTVDAISTFSQHLLGVPIAVHAGTGTVVAGAVVGLLIGIVGAVRPVRRALRMDLAAELSGRDRREEATRAKSPWRGLPYLVVAAGALIGSIVASARGALASWQPAVAVSCFLLCVLCTTFAVGYFTPVLVDRLARSGRWRGAVRLALANLTRNPGRTGVVAVAVASTVGVALMTASYDASVHDSIASGIARSRLAHGLRVQTVAGHDGANEDGRIPPTALAALARVPGVAALEPFRITVAGQRSSDLVAVETADELSGAPAVDSGRLDLAAYRRGGVLVGTALARRFHLRAGSLFALDTPGGRVPVKVVAVWEHGDFGGFSVVMTNARFAALYGPQLPSAVDVVAAPGADLGLLEGRLRSMGLPASLVVSTPAAVVRDSSKAAASQLAPFWALQRALVVVSFVSVMATLLLAGLQRRREFALLSAVGLTPGDQFRTVLAEAAFVGVTATVLGVAIGVIDLGSLVQVTPLLVGYHDPFVVDASSVAVYVPLTVAVAALASLWPGWRVARQPVVEALQYE